VAKKEEQTRRNEASHQEKVGKEARKLLNSLLLKMALS
jgi:hypothetical protein